VIGLRKAILCSSSRGAGVHLQLSLPCAGRAAPATHTACARLSSPCYNAQHLYDPQVSCILKKEMFRKEKLLPEYREIRFLTDLPPHISSVQRCDAIRQTRCSCQAKTSATLTSLTQKGNWERTRSSGEKNPRDSYNQQKIQPKQPVACSY